MKYCNACGACVGDDILECPHCGAEEWSDTEPKKETADPVEADAEEVADAEEAAEVAEESAEETAEETSEEAETDVEESAEAEVEATEESADNSAEDNKEDDSAEETEAETTEESEGEAEDEAEEASAEESTEDIAEKSDDEKSDDEEADDEESDDVDDSDYDDIDEQARKAAMKKKIGIIIGSVLGAVAVVAAVICVFTFVDFSKNPAYDSDEKTFIADENVTGETVAPIPFVSNPPYEMSESFSDYQVNINGAVYQVPMPVQEIINSGWAFGSDENTEKVLAKEETFETYFVSKDGATMYATIINFSQHDTAVDKCYVSRIKVDSKDNLLIKMFMTGNLSLGKATRAQVEELIGESDDIVELPAETIVRYKNNDKAYARLTYNKKTKVLESIEFVNSKKPGNYQETTLPTTTNAYGGVEVTTPEELGKNITSGAVQIQGEIYQLPIKVSDMLNDGWEISFKEDRAILYAGEHLIATLTKGDVTIKGVDVHNLSKEEKLIRNCEIIEISSSPDDKHEVIFPANLKVGMKEAEFKAAIQGKEYEFNEINFDEYVFTEGAYTLMVVVDKDESAVNFILMTYDKEKK